MKICSIEFKNHPILKNLKLDFINKETKKPYDTIIIGGENGCGKTALLDNINHIFNHKMNHYHTNNNDIYSNYTVIFKILPTTEKEFSTSFSQQLKNEIYIVIENQNYSIKDRYYEYPINKNIFYNFLLTNIQIIPTIIVNDNTITDVSKRFVNIEQEDKEEVYKSFIKANKNKKMDELSNINSHLRLNQFTNAFNLMFNDTQLEYYGIKYDSIFFERNGSDFSINSLSSGEKEIVCKTSLLLNEKDTNKTNIVLVDEPENSLHPSWQKKIIKYYETIFSNDEKKTSQIFIATHSPFIMSQALSNESHSVLPIILSRKGDKILKNEEKRLPYDSYNEINYLAFNLTSEGYFNELYETLQNQYNNESNITKSSINDFDKNFFVQEKNLNANKPDSAIKPSQQKVSIITFIRNVIHHRVDYQNNSLDYTEEEFKEAIDKMRNYLSTNK